MVYNSYIMPYGIVICMIVHATLFSHIFTYTCIFGLCTQVLILGECFIQILFMKYRQVLIIGDCFIQIFIFIFTINCKGIEHHKDVEELVSVDDVTLVREKWLIKVC